MLFFYFFSSLFYLAGYIISQKYGIDWLKIVPGSLLLFYFPGHFVNKMFLGNDRKKLGWYGMISIDLLSSIFLAYAVHFIFKSYIGYDENLINLQVILTGAIPASIYFWIYSRERLNGVPREPLIRNKTTILIFLIPFVYFATKLIISPYIVGQDSSHYIEVFKNIVNTGRDFSYVSQARDAFPYLMISSYFFAGIGSFIFFKILIPVFFCVAIMIFYAICKDIKYKPLKISVFLALLSIPAVSNSIERVRPESIIFILICPIVILSTLSITHKNVKLAALALLYTLLATRFHETAFIFLPVVLAILIMSIILSQERFSVKSFIAKHGLPLTVLITILLVLLIPDLIGSVKQIFSNPYLTIFGKLILHGILSPHWNWWFLDRYDTVDGSGTISMPGLTGAAYYYGYNGGFLLLALLVTYILYRRKLKGNSFYRKAILPPLLILIFFFFTSEILPRLNVPLLPDRVWPHIATASIVCIAVLLSSTSPSLRLNKIINTIIVFCILIGVASSYVTTLCIGNFVTAKDIALAKEIKPYGTNALIISTQPSDNLVELYSGKQFLYIDPSTLKRSEPIDKQISEGLEDTVLNYRNDIRKEIKVSKVVSTHFEVNGNARGIDRKLTPVKDLDQELVLLKEFDRDRYEDFYSRLNKFNDWQQRPVYFIYSFYRLRGLASVSSQWMRSNDADDQSYFLNLNNKNVVEKNDNYLVLRIN